VNAHCFPFRQIPHSTRLFLDYLDYVPSVHSFFPRSPRFLEWANEEAPKISYPAARRKQVAEILARQNRAFGASRETEESISAFRAGAWAVVTGQQVGLLGGPAFSIYKALSAVKLAEEARRLGLNCVPIFWLAAEDHDLEEVNQANIPLAEGQIEHLVSRTGGREDAPVGRIAFGGEISDTLARAQQLLGDSEVATLLAECYRPGETFGTAFARLFARLFAPFGVVLVDGSDPELDQIARGLYVEAVERAAELNDSLIRRNERLEADGYHQQVRITPSSTPLFLFENGSRIALHLAETPGKFLLGADQLLEKQQLLELAASSPESFSPNVLLRPVVEDYLLPTVAYVGGAAEIAYFAQVDVLYQALLGRVTPIVPRFSATLIEGKAKALLDRYQLAFSDVLTGPERLRERIGSHLFGRNLEDSFDQAQGAIERSMETLRERLGELDKTLAESASNAESKMLYQLTSLRSRAARAELRQSEVAERHARLVSASIFPNRLLQEREFAGVYFLARHGIGLVGELLPFVRADCLDHQLISF
jgi:bacillithiol synthase